MMETRSFSMKPFVKIFAFLGVAVLLVSCGAWKNAGTTEKTDTGAHTGVLINGMNGLTVGYSGQVLYTEDGGKTWIKGSNQSVCMFGLDLVDDKTCIASGNGGNVIRTQNGGKSWDRLANISASRGKSVSFAGLENGWISSKTWLGETADAGASWTGVPLPQEVKMIETVFFSAPGTGYLVSIEGDLFHTTNGGAAWEKMSNLVNPKGDSFKTSFSENCQHSALRLSGSEGTFACIGTSGKKPVLIIRTTKDGGKTWSKTEKHSLPLNPLAVNLNRDHAISIFNTDSTITQFTN
jgi:photosystem II stability/assembly factor-like uncharacterized protein